MPSHRKEGGRNRDGDQDDDDPFKHFHAAGGRAVRHLAVDTFQRLQFSQNARIPGFYNNPESIRLVKGEQSFCTTP